MKRTRTIAVLTALAMAAASLPGCVTLRTADADPAGQTEIGTAAGEDQRAESLTQTLASVLPSDALSGAEVEGDQVQVDLLSGGDGRSTLEDTRAIQAVYESIRACGFGDTVQTVRIRVFDRNRALLFEQTGHRSEEESRTEDAGNVTEEEIAAQVSGWLEAVPYRTESLSVSPPLPGGTLEIGLRAESVSD
ncbi:MAG: hypothetical protein IKZ41_05990, partial [Clostridia bacterium]|nr:hypothetical protein [Clostridia bacterium]